MNSDKKQEIKIQFLEEAQDYIHILENGILGISSGHYNREQIDQVLRAAHSIKGGAAMMEFELLSDFAHRLEDFLKIIKTGKIKPSQDVESLFLASVDCLEKIVINYRQGKSLDSSWLENNLEPIFTNLHQHLGDFTTEDEEALLSVDSSVSEDDMSVFLFETEVEESLTKLEEIIGNVDSNTLTLELENLCQELSGLGQMLDLLALTELCNSIETYLDHKTVPIQIIAESSLAMFRRSQALILARQKDLLPNQLVVDFSVNSQPKEENLGDLKIEDLNLEDLNIETALEDFKLEEEDLEKIGEDTSSFTNNLEVSEDLIGFFDSFNPDAITEIKEVDQENSQEVYTSQITSILPETKIEKTTLPDKIKSSSEQNQTNIEIEQPTDEITTNTIRVSQTQLDELGDLFGELTIERNGLQLQLKSLDNLLNNLRYKVRHLEKTNFQLRTFYDQIATPSPEYLGLKPTTNDSVNKKNIELESFDLLEMDSYSDLHIVSGEMMETIVQIQEITSDFEIHLRDAEKTYRELTRTSKLMQKNLNQVRMRPFSDLLRRFPRALRQMELQYNKQVNLVIKGGSTLLEKSVLEALSDPLLHLFRNAFDHGIEPPEIRQQKGKPPSGTIEINATYRGNQTIITIKDDGKGIDLEKIRAKAREMGLNEEDLAKVSEKELLDLIFEPGFSTAEQVTDLSGRGVGMDVVKRNIEGIGGEIFVNTKQGIGTTFRITVPFTLSVVRVLLVESNNLLLAFPSNEVEEVSLLESDSILESTGQKFLNWEDSMIRLISLSDYLKFNYLAPKLQIESIPIINEPTLLIIEQGNDLIALQVDRYWGEQEVTIRQIESKIKMPSGFSGCTILGDGRVVPLINPLELLTWIDQQNSGNFPSFSPSIKTNLASLNFQNIADNNLTQNQETIMVIDDSINVRRFLAVTLEKANYHVEQAKDGQDGLEKLQAGIPIKAIICDIEMPRLDGYGFLAQVKNNPKFRQIPVIMLTSRSGEKHRKMAINLGANGYFSKPFKEQELINTIQQLITS
jgi:chemosensory pili system protein ChpA (sensor histidine kinase/response regulator)